MEVGEPGDRRLGALFGLLGAALIALEGLFDLVRGVIYLAVGRGWHAFGSLDQAIILFVVALIVALFSILGGLRGAGRSITSGAVLVVIAVVGWLALGFASGILALLGGILVLIGGVVLLVSGR